MYFLLCQVPILAHSALNKKQAAGLFTMFSTPHEENKRDPARAAGCWIYSSMFPPHSVLAFHRNLHLQAMSTSSWWSVTKYCCLNNPSALELAGMMLRCVLAQDARC